MKCTECGAGLFIADFEVDPNGMDILIIWSHLEDYGCDDPCPDSLDKITVDVVG